MIIILIITLIKRKSTDRMTHFDVCVLYIPFLRMYINVCLHTNVHAFVVQLDVLLSVPSLATCEHTFV